MRRRHQLVAVPKLTAAATSVASPEVTGRTGDRVFDADVDGTRVRICARDEVVIECGRASITLRRNGRVVIRGTYVETRSAGTNRIRGGQVRVN
jgi:hypothetical protein